MNLARHTPFLRIALLVLAALPAFTLAQTPSQNAGISAERRQRTALIAEAAQAIADEEKITEAALPRFDLDFPGGTPADLIAAIEKASGQTLNVIIPAEYAQLPLPSLRLKNVNVPRLFKAFGEATQKTVRSGNFSVETTVNFITQDERVSPSSIWYFHVRGFAPNVVATRFYSLAPYLRADITVDDITTAIRTGWELRGVKAPPILKFHQETQLLIAVGEPEELAVIVDVLDVLTKTIAVRETAAAKH